MHSNKLLHLDIKPGNIYVRNDGTPLLIDFGAARQTLTAEALKLPPMYTPGLRLARAPPRTAPSSGPGATSTRWARRSTPALPAPAAAGDPARGEGPHDARARKGWAGKYSAELLDTVDWCLRLDHLERPQSVFALQKALLGEKEPGFRGEAPMLDQWKDAILRRLKG